MLYNMAQLLADGKKNHYGILGACPMGPDQISWCFETASKLRAPLIICNHASVMLSTASMPLSDVGDAVKYFSNKYPEVPAALCLDHGSSFEDAERAIRAGFTGVMVDKSMLPVEENIRVLKEVTKMAHAVNVGVEAGLGGTTWRDPTPEEIIANLTKVDEYKKLVSETNVDVVAVFVGGSHGDNKDGSAVLHYDLIEELRDASEAALCMHGSSGTGDEKLAKAAKAGLTKFNVAGDLLAGGSDRFGEVYGTGDKTNDSIFDYETMLKEGYIKRVTDYMEFLGSTNKY